MGRRRRSPKRKAKIRANVAAKARLAANSRTTGDSPSYSHRRITLQKIIILVTQACFGDPYARENFQMSC
jgi:hypothetical protein